MTVEVKLSQLRLSEVPYDKDVSKRDNRTSGVKMKFEAPNPIRQSRPLSKLSKVSGQSTGVGRS